MEWSNSTTLENKKITREDASKLWNVPIGGIAEAKRIKKTVEPEIYNLVKSGDLKLAEARRIGQNLSTEQQLAILKKEDPKAVQQAANPNWSNSTNSGLTTAKRGGDRTSKHSANWRTEISNQDAAEKFNVSERPVRTGKQVLKKAPWSCLKQPGYQDPLTDQPERSDCLWLAVLPSRSLPDARHVLL